MEGVPEILYETCYHATGICSPDSVPGTREGGGWGISTFIPSRGLKKLQEKWSSYTLPKSLKKEMSLFISPNGEYVAVAARNQIQMLHKDDKYMEACGFYSGSDKRSNFTHGAWSDSCALLGLVDDKNDICIVKPSGLEIIKMTKTQTKISASIVGLFMLDNADTKSTYKCAFNILTSDGLLHRIEINQELSVTMPFLSTSSSQVLLKKQYPRGASCLDFHQNLSFLILVGPSGISGYRRGNAECSLSLWHVSKGSELQLLFSTQYEGFFHTMESHERPLTIPKVVISPEGAHVAVLDLTGNLDVFNLDSQQHSLSIIAFCEEFYREMGCNTLPGGRKCIIDIVDITWWSDSSLVIAKRNSSIIIVNVKYGVRLLETDLAFSSPVLGRVTYCNGFVFLLEGNLDVKNFGQVTHDMHDKQEIGRITWKLLSFSERSVSEMYKILLNGQQYEAAFQFAERHAMDIDEIFKSQWLSSSHGMNEISSYLYNVKDANFVLSQCLNASAPTEEATKALLLYGLHMTDKYRFLETENNKDTKTWDYRMWRLQLLQSRDRLDTFLGINMGRFSMHDYRKFQVLPLNKVAVGLAESGKIGALNLLFKRHLYSISPFIFEILASIPETIPVQTYSQLLPGRSPPSNIALREKDWVEEDQMISFIRNNSDLQSHESGVHVKTEHVLKQLNGFLWPSVSEVSRWYMERAMEMDSLSGQLENCLSLLDTGCRKGLLELQQLYEDALCFYDFVYSGGHDEENIGMSLVSWKQLSDYEKFKLLMGEATEDTVMETLRTKSIPFMQRQWRIRADALSDQVEETQVSVDVKQDSLLVTWLKEIAEENKLEICLVVIDEACKDFHNNDFFKDEIEATEVILDCLYLCTLTDRWNIMASILSKVPFMSLRYKAFPVDRDFSPRQGVQGFGSPRKNDKPLNMLSIPIHLKEGVANVSTENLEKRVKQAEGHIESGRLLAYYQVPKPLCFFLEADSDEKGVKQLLRLILSKFGRWQPTRSDNDWANMWRDMLCFQEKAFSFLDSEYMLLEFCRGLLKSGKFSLARNYLKGTSTISLASEKAECLVIQAAREYFFSASSLDCSEIWKAKECLNLFPNSKTVRAEIDIVDALTTKLPNLGVTLLPMQYRQIRSPMEIINMVLASQSGAYLNVDEILEVAKLLGLSSADDTAAVEETVAREAAVTGDLELAFDLCLALARKGHGSIWDLSAAIGRGPTLDNMNVNSRKELLVFALSHCDEESVLELLQAWKDLDMQSQCENLVLQTGSQPPNASIHGSSLVSFSVYSRQDIMDAKGYSRNMVENISLSENECLEQLHGDLKRLLSGVAKEVPGNCGSSWDELLKENGKFLSFAALQLPWLLELINDTAYDRNEHPPPNSATVHYHSVRFQAVKAIISWLVNNNVAPSDDLIASLAKSVMQASPSEEDAMNGCLYLLNLGDAFRGVEVIEEQVRARKGYQEISSITDLGMLYGLLHNSGSQCVNRNQRKNLLLQIFQGKHASLSPDVIEQVDSVQSTFWREWKSKLEEQKSLADQARELEQIIPGIETARFLSGDIGYVRSTVFAFIDSVRLEKKHILQNALKIAYAYGMSQIEVLLHYLGSSLLSEIWTEDDIEAEISHHKKDLLAYPSKVIHMISSTVYAEIDGHNKQRLSYLYGILSDCCTQLGEVESAALGLHGEHSHRLNLCEFYQALKEECKRVSFITGLNFKNIAGLGGLNLGQLHTEVCSHIDESTVEALAQMVDALVGNFEDSGLLSRQDVYKYLVLYLLKDLENGIEVSDRTNCDDFRVLIFELEKNYERCSRYFKDILEEDVLDMFMRYYALSLPCSRPTILTADSAWQQCLVLLLNLWIRLADDLYRILFHEKPEKVLVLSKWRCLSRCLTFWLLMVVENKITPNEGWGTIFEYVENGSLGAHGTDVLDFCKAMLFSGCGFGAIGDLYVKARTQSQNYNIEGDIDDADSDLCCFYVNLTESLLTDLSSGSDVDKKLQYLVSSLSKQVDFLGNSKKKVRYAVWKVLCAFSENMQIPNMYRVYALELLQSITGRKEGSRNAQISVVQPWEGWAESCSPVISESVEQNEVVEHGMSRKFTNTLVALKSNEMISAAWPGVEIIPNDLISIQSAVSCFSYLATSAVSETHIHTLQRLLEEWEGLFSSDECQSHAEGLDGKDDAMHGTGSNWNGDEWDDGWETFRDDLVVPEGKANHAFSVHPLHACWRIILLKLVGFSQFSQVVKCVDNSLVNPKVTILEEDEARSLSLLLISTDCFIALKFVLLLPYQVLWFECLTIVDAKLKEGGGQDASSGDSDLLALILSSGIMSAVVSDTQYGNVTSYLCYLAGYFSHVYREDQLHILKHAGTNQEIRERCYIFGRIIFPYFIAELVRANQYLLAGVLVSKFMHTHSSLSLINVAEASLRKFLAGQLECNQEEEGLKFEEKNLAILNSITKLGDKLSNSLESALLALSTDMK